MLGAALFLGVPVPALAATGLAIPLPNLIYRMAVSVAERTQALARTVVTLSAPHSGGTAQLVVSAAVVQTSEEHAARLAAPAASPLAAVRTPRRPRKHPAPAAQKQLALHQVALAAAPPVPLVAAPAAQPAQTVAATAAAPAADPTPAPAPARSDAKPATPKPTAAAAPAPAPAPAPADPPAAAAPAAASADAPAPAAAAAPAAAPPAPTPAAPAPAPAAPASTPVAPAPQPAPAPAPSAPAADSGARHDHGEHRGDAHNSHDD